MREKQQRTQQYLPFSIFSELKDERSYRYGYVATWGRARKRFLKKIDRITPEYDLTPEGVLRAIDASLFGDALDLLSRHGLLDLSRTRFAPMANSEWPMFQICFRPEEPATAHWYGQGRSLSSFSEALSKAIGELLERSVLYVHGSLPDKAKIVPANDPRIPRAVIHDSPRYFDWQKKYLPKALTRRELERDNVLSREIRCLSAHELFGNRRSILLPEQFVVWGMNKTLFDNFTFRHPTTSGAGGGFSAAQATISGLCELIERDGFLIYWLNEIPPDRIVLDEGSLRNFPPDFSEAYSTLRDRGHEIILLDTTTDVGVPSVAAILISTESGKKIIRVGGGAHLDPKRAIMAAVVETMHRGEGGANNIEGSPIVLSEECVPFTDHSITKEARLALALSGALYSRMRPFIAGKEILYSDWKKKFSGEDLDESGVLGYLLECFHMLSQKHGPAYGVYAYESNDSILSELEYHVVKVVVPALMPLYLNEPYATLDCARLRDVPKRMGRKAKETNAYNPIPHPFP